MCINKSKESHLVLNGKEATETLSNPDFRYGDVSTAPSAYFCSGISVWQQGHRKAVPTSEVWLD